jgi:hypothetical protein
MEENRIAWTKIKLKKKHPDKAFKIVVARYRNALTRLANISKKKD